MTATPDPERGRQGERGGQSPDRGMPDPWGVKRAENLLTSLQGVLSARVVVSPIGEVTEIHVLTQPGTPPKQVVRNVESALLAQLGVKVDHRRISVAQTADVKPIEALERSAVRDRARRRQVIFQKLEIKPGRPNRVTLVVTMSLEGDEVIGEAECADTAKARLQAAARAAVVALERAVPDATLELDGCKLTEQFDKQYAFSSVHVVEGRGQPAQLTGTCEVQESAEQAAALSVLDATNRWLSQKR